MASVSAPRAPRPRATPIVALDVPSMREALALIQELGDLCDFYKVGSELFTAEGPAVVRAVRDRGADVFLDLKFHDIPNTVRGAARSAAALGARLITVHAAGGQAMLEAAVAGSREGGGASAGDRGRGTTCEVLAVTILTSLEAAALAASWGRPVSDVSIEVLRLAALAHAAGVPGVVCSGLEAAAIRSAFGDKLSVLVPGVRMAGPGAKHDQARVVTPRQAADAGARYVVLGRTVTGAISPREAMSNVLADLS